MLVAKQHCTHEEETATGYIEAPKKQRRKGFRRLIGLVLINLVILVCVNLLVHGMLLQQNYQSKALEKQIKELDRQLLEMQMEVSGLGSFERIQEVAVTKLGMQLPDNYDNYSIHKKTTRPYKVEAIASKNVSRTIYYENNLWSQAVAWLSSLGATMAKDR